MIPSKARSWTIETYGNPEVTAMSDIAAILQQLPDDAARLRVMRWAFGRFSSEFKRPVPVALTIATPAAARPAVTPQAPPPAVEATQDFGRQISELTDLFPEREKDEVDAVPDLWPA